MTNKPMLSVELELLDRIAGIYVGGLHRDGVNALQELRALLDARHVVCSNGILCQNSKCAECGGNGAYKPARLGLVECDACPTSSGCVSTCMKAPKPAAQHQGEPVAWSLEVEGYTTVLYENYQKALSEQEHFRGRGRTAEIHPLHREQPAPVAVVMPEHTMRSVMEVTQEASQFYEPGTSNWCSHIANRLNGVKP